MALARRKSGARVVDWVLVVVIGFDDAGGLCHCDAFGEGCIVP